MTTQQALEHVQSVVQLLTRWADGPNIISHFVRPILEWLQKRESFAFVQFTHTPDHICDSTGRLIDRLLLSVQGILALPHHPLAAEPDAAETPDRFLREHSQLVARITRALKLDEVSSLLSTVINDAVGAPQDELSAQLARVLPFLDAYLELARVQLTNHCAWTKALFKLDYVVCSVMHSVAKDGFCKPPGAEAGAGEGEGAMEDASGMGMGEGTGKENVSKEIEDESQVEGLQGEADEDEDVERAEEGDALEMSEDFGGKMQDVPDKEGEEEGEEEDEKDEDGEPEEQVGDLDAMDPSAVDEKLWGDEGGPEDDKKDQGKSEQDHSTKKQEKESEMTAKEEDGVKGKDKEKSKEQAAQEDGKESEGEQPVPEEADGQEQAMDEGEADQQGGAPLDDFIQEAETLDLPEDMDFGKDEGKESQLDEDTEMDEEDDIPEEERPGDDDGKEAEEKDVEMDGENPQAMPEDVAQPEGATEDIVDATAQPDLHAGTGQDSGEADDHAMAEANQGEGGQGPSSSGEAGGPELNEREDVTKEGTSQEPRAQQQ